MSESLFFCGKPKVTGILSEKGFSHLWIKLLFILHVFIYSSLPILSLDPMRRAQHFLGSVTAQNHLGPKICFGLDMVLGFFFFFK